MAMVAKPIIPQTRIRFTGSTSPRILPSAGATVAVPLVHDWGPLGSELTKPEVLASFAEWTDRYGDSDTAGRTAVAEAFTGQGINGSGSGSGGAGGVIPLRMGAGAVRAVATVTNTTPGAALRLTARWAGTRGNDYSFVIDPNPVDASQDRFRLRYKGAVIDTFLYPKANITALAAAINARSNSDVTAEALISGVALTPTASTGLGSGTPGSNGTTPNSSDYLSALDALEFQPFTLLAPYNLTTDSIQTAILSWVRAQETANRPVIFVVGGLAGETVDTAITRSTLLADPHVVNFGVGTYHDDLLNRDLSTAELAPRIAGILAARGESSALTGAELGGLHVVGTTGATTTDAETGILQGVTCAIRTDSPDADLRIAKGVTTFTSTVDPARPVQIFSEPRFIRIMDNFVRNMRQWGDRKIIGGVPVNEDTRDAVRQYGGQLIDDLLLRGLILTKAEGAEADPFIRTPATVDDTVPFEFGWQFAYTANYLLGEGSVR